MKRNLYLYYLFSFLSNFALFSGVLVPFFTQWGHLTLSQTLLLQSWFTFWMFILEIPTGALADFASRKLSLIVGALVTALATFTYGLYPNLYLFLLAEFFFAFGAACISGANEAFLYDTLKQYHQESHSASFFGRNQSISLFAMMVSAPLGSVIAGKLGLNWPTLCTTIPMLGAGFAALWLREPVHSSPRRESTRYLDVIKDGFTYIAHHAQLKRMAIDTIVVAVVAYYVIWLYQPLLTSGGVNVKLFGWFHALLLGSELLVASQFNRLEKLAGSPAHFMHLTAALTGVSFILVSLIPNLVTISFFIIMGGGFGLTRLHYATSQLNHLIPSHRRATIISAITMVRRGGDTLTNLVVGPVSDLSLSIAIFFLGLIALSVGLVSRLYPKDID